MLLLRIRLPAVISAIAAFTRRENSLNLEMNTSMEGNWVYLAHESQIQSGRLLHGGLCGRQPSGDHPYERR